MLDVIEYLGHYILAVGLHPTQEKIKAIAEVPAPHNVDSFIFGSHKLLRKIFAKPLQHAHTSLSTPTETKFNGPRSHTVKSFSRS